MFHRTFQSSIALLGIGRKEVKKGLKENIMTFESKELISVKIALFESMMLLIRFSGDLWNLYISLATCTKVICELIN